MLDAYFANALSGVHTSLVATVTAYDEKTHRATVKPSVRMLMDNGIQIELPELVDVPVVFPSSKAFDMEFPLDKGDGVLLVFQEQDVSAWKNGDRNAAPSVSSRFGLDAAIAIPGCFPKPTKGKARIVVDSDGVITWEAKKIVFKCFQWIMRSFVRRWATPQPYRCLEILFSILNHWAMASTAT